MNLSKYYTMCGWLSCRPFETNKHWSISNTNTYHFSYTSIRNTFFKKMTSPVGNLHKNIYQCWSSAYRPSTMVSTLVARGPIWLVWLWGNISFVLVPGSLVGNWSNTNLVPILHQFQHQVYIYTFVSMPAKNRSLTKHWKTHHRNTKWRIPLLWKGSGRDERIRSRNLLTWVNGGENCRASKITGVCWIAM